MCTRGLAISLILGPSRWPALVACKEKRRPITAAIAAQAEAARANGDAASSGGTFAAAKAITAVWRKRPSGMLSDADTNSFTIMGTSTCCARNSTGAATRSMRP